MNHEAISSLVQLVKERHKDTQIHFECNYATEPGRTDMAFLYICKLTAYVPETCAVVVYMGNSHNFDEAFQRMTRNVVYNEPELSELG